MSRIEDLISALLKGETVYFEPQSRMEAYFLSCLTSGGVESLPNPVSRLDILLYQLADILSSGGAVVASDSQMYTLVLPTGEEISAVLVDEKTEFTATDNDVREGVTYASEGGASVGTKVIPTAYVTEGYRLIPNGSAIEIPNLGSLDRYDFTKLQAIVCQYSGNIAGSVAADKVTIDEKVYAVSSSEVLSTLTRDDTNKSINFGLVNDSGGLYLLRYFATKEAY